MLLSDNLATDFTHGKQSTATNPFVCVDDVYVWCLTKSRSVLFNECILISHCSSLLIVYEGYEDPKDMLPMDGDLLPVTSPTADINSSKGQGDNQLRPMEDDSHSGNCSYDADASNDSIELNLSLDEQQPDTQPTHAYTSNIQSNHLPVSLLCRIVGEKKANTWFHRWFLYLVMNVSSYR